MIKSEGVEIKVNKVGKDDPILVIQLGGYVDQANCHLLQVVIDRCLSEQYYMIIFDVHQLVYMSSAGWGVMIGEIKRFREKGGDIKLANMDPAIYEIYQMLEFYHMISEYASVESALQAFECFEVNKVGNNITSNITNYHLQKEFVIKYKILSEKPILILLFEVRGFIDIEDNIKLKKLFTTCIQNGFYNIIIDLSNLVYMVTPGWGTIISNIKYFRKKGGDVKVINMRVEIRNVYKIMKLYNIFTEYVSLQHALNSFYNKINLNQSGYKTDHEKKVTSSHLHFKYDVAISFAGEDREIAEQLATGLIEKGIKVFYDAYETVELWGKNLYDHFSFVFNKEARFCVMLISKNYTRKVWPNHERVNAQARALIENDEYILPIRIDNTWVPGLPDTIGYISLFDKSIGDIIDLIEKKLSI